MESPSKVPYRIAFVTKNKDELINYLLGYKENLELELFNDTYFLYEFPSEDE